MSTNIEIDGIANILSKIEQLGLSIDEKQDEALREAAKLVRESARQNIQINKSVRTGTLLKSIKLSPIKKRKVYKYKYIRILTKDPVAHLVELGHGGPMPAPAYPFLGPAFENNKTMVKDIIKSKLMEALR